MGSRTNWTTRTTGCSRTRWTWGSPSSTTTTMSTNLPTSLCSNLSTILLSSAQKKVDTSTFWDSVMALVSLRLLCAYIITQLTRSFGSSAFFNVQNGRKFIFIQDVVNIYF